MAKNCAVHGQCVNKRSIIYERKVSHLNKRVLPAGRMVLHLRKKIVSYPEGGFFIPIRKVNHSSASSIHLRQRGNSFESKRWLIVEKGELHSFMASSREVLPWNLQLKPFLGKSCCFPFQKGDTIFLNSSSMLQRNALTLSRGLSPNQGHAFFQGMQNIVAWQQPF